MSIWFLLWLFLSAALLYFFGWSLLILQRQKYAWKAFAQKRGLRFTQGRFAESPQINGLVDNYTTGLFTGEHESDDGRTTRKMTAVEITLSSRMPFEGAVASGGMVRVARSMAFREEFQPENANWNKAWIAATANRGAFSAYLTNERIDALVSLMKLKNAWVIFVFRGDTVLLRLDTSDPLANPQKIEQLLQRMTQVARTMELKTGEDANLKTVMARAPTRQATAAPKAAGGDLSLELEEDEKPSEPKPEAD